MFLCNVRRIFVKYHKIKEIVARPKPWGPGLGPALTNLYENRIEVWEFDRNLMKF
jgi:hypothetical protein